MQLKKFIKYLYLNIFYISVILLSSLISIIPKNIRHELALIIRVLRWSKLNIINNNEKTVYFFSIKPHTRERLFAKYAKENGFRVTLFTIDKVKEIDCLLFDNYFTFKNIVELQLISWVLKDQVQHFFGLDGSKLYGFIKMQLNPVITDIYDTCEGRASSYFLQKRMEAYVIQNAVAITHRDLRIKNLYSNFEREDKLDAFIPDIPVSLTSNTTTHKSIEREIHLVSTGWIDGNANNILRTSEIFCRNGIHVHIYYNPFQVRDSYWSKQYSNLEKQSKFFHIENPIYGSAYFEEISKYDFGLSLYDPWTFCDSNLEYSDIYIASCGSSRIVDYISVGLTPIVCPLLEFQIKMIEDLASSYILADNSFYENPRDRLLEAIENQKNNSEKFINLEVMRQEQSILIGNLYVKFRTQI